MLLCLSLLFHTYGEDHWREQLRRQLVQASGTDNLFWSGLIDDEQLSVEHQLQLQ
jgi:hypothetical protein